MESVSKYTFNSQKWRSCPVIEESFFKTAALILCILVASIATAYMLGVWYGILGFLLIAFSLAKYFVPTAYELSEEGVQVKFGLFTKKKKWNYYTRYSVRHDGIFLSPFKAPSRVDSFRGDFLKFGNTVDYKGVQQALDGVFNV